MQVIQESSSFALLRFDQGERFPEAFSEWFGRRQLGAFFYGLGGARRLQVAWYDLANKTYQPREFSGQDFEIVSLTGNMARFNDSPKVHCHISFSDRTYQTFGGHLEWLEVGGTLELHVQFMDGLERVQDEETGLALLN